MSTLSAKRNPSAISILMVDDNQELCRALAVYLPQAGFEWRGYLTRADFLTVHLQVECPDVDIVLLDFDMPGRDVLALLPELAKHCPSVRAIIYSGHCTKELVEAAIAAGAKGYVCKIDGEDSLIQGIKSVMAGDVYLSPDARRCLGSVEVTREQ